MRAVRAMLPRPSSLGFIAANDTRFAGRPSTALGIVALAVLAVVYAALYGDYGEFLVALTAAYTVSALGYNAALGYSGQMVFSQAGFMAAGAYTFAILAEQGISLWLCFAAAGAATLTIGLIVSLIVARMRELYLALVTLAFAQATIVLIALLPASGGYDGISVPALSENRLVWSLGILAVAILVLARIVSSRLGRSFVMVRDDEIAAAAMGVSPTRARVIAFSIAALYGGIGGAMLGMTLGYISPANFGIDLTIFLLTVIVVGGLGSVWGTVLASTIFVYMDDQLAGIGNGRDFIYAALLVLTLAVLPKGLASLWRVAERHAPGFARPASRGDALREVRPSETRPL